jgi:hypothetical protein
VLLALRDQGVECDGVVSRLSQGNITRFFPNTDIIDDRVSEHAAASIIRKCDPDLAVFGTSEPEDPVLGKPEATFVHAARREKVPSIAVLDFWTGYRARFSLSGSEELDALPDAICIMDERANQGMVAEGFPNDGLFVTGNPHWDQLKGVKRSLIHRDRQELKARMGLVGRRLILFISQPLSGLEGRKQQFDYDERGVINMVSRSIERAGGDDDTALLVKPHPREDVNALSSALRYPASVETRIMGADEDVYRTGWAADLIVGMFSMLLVEYALLGLPVVSFQPTVRPDDTLKLGFGIEVITSEDDLDKILRNGPTSALARLPGVDFGATDRVLEVIRKNCNDRIGL